MEHPADFQLLEADGRLKAELTGDWTSRTLGDAPDRLRGALSSRRPAMVDLKQVGRCDTSGAYAVVRAAGETKTPIEARPETERLIANPRRFRWAPFVALAERAGLDALPIVGVTSFFIGAVVGLLGAHMLAQFGAQVFAVELVGIAVLREFAIIITAVLLAGRSASSFAAEIGSMKMNQEIDAMRVMGVDPFEALVLPRFMALLCTIPLLTFVAALAGLAGGMIVLWGVLDLSPGFFIQRIVDEVGASHFWIGMSKSPVMAIVMAALGCRQGMEVSGDVESLGRRVTSAVVHAIFSIILIDALFAVVYMEANL